MTRAAPAPVLAIVIPTLAEEAALPGLLGDLRDVVAHRDVELVVADGGSADRTVAIAEAAGARVVHAPRGRGRQLRAGAVATTADWLLFLHADVRLPWATPTALFRMLPSSRRVAGWFPLRIDAPGWRYRLVERGATMRARWLGLPYGDQGLLVHRELYAAAGGYDDVPLMEDVQLVRRLRRWGRLRALPAPVVVSARRWQRDGVLRRTVRNWGVLARWMLGASPDALAERYRQVR